MEGMSLPEIVEGGTSQQPDIDVRRRGTLDDDGFDSVVEGDLNLGCARFSKERTAWCFVDFGNSVIGGFAKPFILSLLMAGTAQYKANGAMRYDTCSGEGSLDCTSGSCLLDGEVFRPENVTKCEACTGNGMKLWSNFGSDTWQLEPPNDIPFFGKYETFAYWILVVSFVVQVFSYIMLGPIADYKTCRKTMLVGATVLGAICCLCFLTAAGEDAYIVVAVFTTLVSTLYGLSSIAYNSCIPLIVNANKELQSVKKSPEEKEAFRQANETELSTQGSTFGYVGQILGCFFSCLIIVLLTESHKTTYPFIHYRVAMVFVGCWWLVFTIPAMLWLKPRTSSEETNASLCMGWILFTKGVKTAWKSVDLWRYLLVFFFAADMFNTITYVGVLIARQNLCFSVAQLILLVVITTVSSILGGVFFLQLEKRIKMSPVHVIMGLLSVYALSGFWIAAGASQESFGLRAPWEIYVFGFVHGLCVGPLQAYLRSVFCALVPHGQESAFFCFYSIFDKGSAITGPAVMALIIATTDQVRWGGIYISLSAIGASLILRFAFNLERAKEERAKTMKCSTLRVMQF